MLRQFARGEPSDPGDDPFLIEVLSCYKRDAFPRSGGLYDQDWDFVFWTIRLDQYVTEHQIFLAKHNQ